MTSTLGAGDPTNRQYVTNLDLGGGLNTRKDIHALNRNQLAVLVNAWYSTANALSKRPGTVPIITAGGEIPAFSTGTPGVALAACEFGGVTYLIAQNGTTLSYAAVNGNKWTTLGNIGNGGVMSVAQIYDPDNPAFTGSQDGTVFIATGVDTPWVWTGPGGVFKAMKSGPGFCPTNFQQTAPITPAYVTTVGNNSLLMFSGEPTYPSAVYVSQPFFPEQFVSNQSATSSYPGSYYPMLVGQNDGVNGGSITGISYLGSMVIVYKQSAIYRLAQVGLMGDLVWQSQNTSASVGMVAPKSLADFDTFHCFLGLDGVYSTDGYQVRQLSANVPTYFDGSTTGFPATVTSRYNAVGVRHGLRYEIFFNGSPTSLAYQ